MIMPKKIENVREQLLQEAKQQIIQNGYAQTTIRSVASACGLGVGTVYNYFASKDHLIASFMAEEWLELLDTIRANDTTDQEQVLKGIVDALRTFTDSYHALFSDRDAAKVFYTVFAQRHSQLRAQLATIIRPLCDQSPAEDAAFLAEYIAESLLTWTVAGRSFEAQYAIIRQLL